MRPQQIHDSFGARAAAGLETSAGRVPLTVGTRFSGVALVNPPSGAPFGAGTSGHGCPERADLADTAKDCAGVSSVRQDQDASRARCLGGQRGRRA